MDKVNQDLICSLNRLDEIEALKGGLESESQQLTNTIHAIFNQSEHNTKEAEYQIIKRFWSQAYSKYADGGYITNDSFISEARFAYEREVLRKLISEYVTVQKYCLDIGCGDGRYTHFFANAFENSLGVDLSQERIQTNNDENTCSKVSFSSVNFTHSSAFKGRKFDLIFVGDIFMYTHDEDVDSVFECMLNLLSEDGTLIVRESTSLESTEYYRSKNYVAYYRPASFYESGIFRNSWQKTVRNSSYNLYHMDKLFNAKRNYREKVIQEPLFLDQALEEINKVPRSGHFFVYKAVK